MRKTYLILSTVIAVIVIITVSLIGSIRDRPLAQQDFYQETMKELDAFHPISDSSSTGWKTAWASINITPSFPMPMAGYAPRDKFESVHDSIFIRLLAINNKNTTAFIISADLLIFPPALKRKIESLNTENHFLYFSATHTHSSLGAWNNSVIGNLILGKYNDEWLDLLAKKINTAMHLALTKLQPSAIEYFEADAKEYVENRIDPEHGSVDGKLRGFKINRTDNKKALLFSYSGHPTNISHLSRAISGDYVNAVIRNAETNDYHFAMFVAGMIGSHRTKYTNEKEFVYCDSLGNRLYKKIKSSTSHSLLNSQIAVGKVNLHYGPSQLHILQRYKVRDWAFRFLFEKLEGNISYLKLGSVVMLAMPCDFSGEIFTDDHLREYAKSKNETLFITSFNGDYVGYITSDKHYGHSEQEEIMALNWVGPHFGTYYSEVVKKIIDK